MTFTCQRKARCQNDSMPSNCIMYHSSSSERSSTVNDGCWQGLSYFAGRCVATSKRYISRFAFRERVPLPFSILHQWLLARVLTCAREGALRNRKHAKNSRCVPRFVRRVTPFTIAVGSLAFTCSILLFPCYGSLPHLTRSVEHPSSAFSHAMVHFHT